MSEASVAQIRARIQEQLQRHREIKGRGLWIGLQVDGAWEGPETVEVDGSEVPLFFCRSPLEMRERMSGSAPPAALLVPFADEDLSDDLRARLARHRLLRMERWPVVRSLFGAAQLDPRVAAEPELAELLISSAPLEGYDRVPTGYLDWDTALDQLFRAALGISAAEVHGPQFLAWAERPEAQRRWSEAQAKLREFFAPWVEDRAGRMGPAIVACMDAGKGSGVVAFGLACRVLEDPAVDVSLASSARARFEERFLDGTHVERDALLDWADLAEELLRTGLDPSEAKVRLARAESCLEEIDLKDHAWASDLLPLAFRQRRSRLGERISEALEALEAQFAKGGARSPSLVQVEEALASLQRHELATVAGRDQVEGAEMAVRLLRWLGSRASGSEAEPGGGLAMRAQRYLESGAYVDWARAAVWRGDGDSELEAAYRRLSSLATRVREQENAEFGEVLRTWCAGGHGREGLALVERIVPDVLAPLGEVSPVLLVVLDGMSGAVFAELVADLARRNWIEYGLRGDEGAVRRLPGVAVFPTVTQLSRAALLTGNLQKGQQNVERAGFQEHSSLREVSNPAYPPTLYHKGDLTESGSAGLASAVREDIANSRRKVVGVVLNAVDDFLAAGDQTYPRWHTDFVRLLGPLLDAAFEGGRVAVLTADHGHVLERDMEYRTSPGASARWREGESADEGEVVLEGSRVLTGKSVVVPWSEKLRYGKKQNGYHGGVSPQEVIVPVAVLAADDRELEAWAPLPPAEPAWWSAEFLRVEAEESVVRPTKGPQKELFPSHVAKPGRAKRPAWIAALFKSKVYQQQVEMTARIQLDEGRIEAVLGALDSHGGTLTQAALASEIEASPIRLRGFLASLQKRLNVEGFEVLGVTDAGVRLELPLLFQQFDISKKAQS